MTSPRKIYLSFRRRLTEFGTLTPIALVTTFLPILGSSLLLVIGYPLGTWLRANQEVGAVAYTVGVAVVCGLALMPTNLIGVLGGYAFGFYLGFALLMTAIVAAAFLSFLIHRRIAGDKISDIAEKHPKAEAVYKALLGKSFSRTLLIVLLIRFSILMPFALTNFVLAAAKVRPSIFVLGTFVGMLPRSGAVVLTGAGLSELTLDAPENYWLIASGIAATLISIIVISIVSRRALEKLTERESM